MSKEGEGKLNKAVGSSEEVEKIKIDGEESENNGEIKAEKSETVQETFGKYRDVKEVLDKTVSDSRLAVLWEAQNEFPERVQNLLEKLIMDEAVLSPDETLYFDQEAEKWWQERFGISFAASKKVCGATERTKKLVFSKRERITLLTRELAAIDLGETIESFEDENRHTVFYNEDSESFYIIENGLKKDISVGDIAADYGWGLKYVPDGNMPHMVFRRLAKRILINESRRDIEKIYNRELSGGPKGDYKSVDNLLAQPVIKFEFSRRGQIAEVMVRELLTRLSYNGELGFVVERANAIEDGTYKYDFKIKTSRRRRGVAVEDELKQEKSKKIGIQFTIQKKGSARKVRYIAKAKRKYKDTIPVDEIIFLRVSTQEFDAAFKKWLKAGRPSGGPERFLSKNLKIKLLKESISYLVKISDEELERIFPPEPTESSEKKAA